MVFEAATSLARCVPHADKWFHYELTYRLDSDLFVMTQRPTLSRIAEMAFATSVAIEASATACLALAIAHG